MAAVPAMVYAEAAAPAPIPERLASLCAAVTLAPDDVDYLKNTLSTGGPSECLALAILGRHSQAEFSAVFKKYFAIDRSIKTIVLADDEINRRLIEMIKARKGRQPAEVAADVYLAMRGKGLAAKKPDGEVLNLEVMFRGSVFAAVSGGSEAEVTRLTEVADSP